MKTWTRVFFALALACGTSDDDTSAGASTGDESSATDTAPSTSMGSSATENDAGTGTSSGAGETDTTTTDTTTTDTTTTDTAGTGGTPLLPCEELSFGLSCSNPQAAIGYPACSDYFGDLTGVEVTCKANPNVTVSESPCAAYEHYVGSCIYYNEALPDRCYITHVGADSADLIEAGRAFWQNPGVCANWIDGP